MGIDTIKLKEPYIITDESILKEFNSELYVIFIPEKKTDYSIYGMGIHGSLKKPLCLKPSQINF